MNTKGRLFVISGPSGAGKDAVINEVLKMMPELKFSVSTITRQMRKGEIEGQKYNFVSAEVFEKMIKNDELLEYAVYCGNYYGTPKKPIEKWLSNNNDVLVEVEVHGAEKIRKIFPQATFIFIIPPSVEALRTRLTARRTEEASVAKSRLEVAVAEISRAADYDYVIVNEENKVKKAARCFCDIINMSDGYENYKTKNMLNFIEEVLKNA